MAEQQGMLSKGLAILTVLGDHPRGASVTDIARAADLPISTVHRLLALEIEHGFVALDPATKTYRLGVRVFELANKVSGVRSIGEIARPLMSELAHQTGETVQLSVLSDGRALFIEKVGTEQAVGIRGSVGESEPLHATSTGKILLATLPAARLDALVDQHPLVAYTPNTITDRAALLAEIERVRADDVSTADEEFDAGVRAMGVPVRTGRGEVRAALCISAPAFRVSLEQLRSWLPRLRETAAAIGVQLPVAG